MSVRKRVSALVLPVVLLATSALAASERPHLSSDPRVNEARTLIEAGHHEEALATLRPLATHHPDHTDVLFLVGLAAINASQRTGIGDEERDRRLEEAVAALRNILVDRPDLVRVRLELARAFFLKGQDDLARKHFDRVLAGRLPPAMVSNIHRFLDVMRARRRWSGRFGFAFGSDSNVAAASEAEVIHIHGLPFRRSADARPDAGVGVVAWGGVEHQRPLNERTRLRTGADFARREHSGRRFDSTYLSTHAGPRWLVGASSEVSLLGSVRRRFTAGDSDNRELGARIETEHRLSRKALARLPQLDPVFNQFRRISTGERDVRDWFD